MAIVTLGWAFHLFVACFTGFVAESLVDLRYGSNGNPMQITIIAEGSIDISGNQDFEPNTADLQFVTDGDLQITGNFETHAPGQMLVHEQIRISGNIELIGQLIAEDAATVSDLVTQNTISGNVDTTYNGGFSSGSFGVSGWRDIRDAN